jgi:hypothetical protein
MAPPVPLTFSELAVPDAKAAVDELVTPVLMTEEALLAFAAGCVVC